MSTAVRWIVVALLTVHGLVHLLGTAKGWGLARVVQLKEPISPLLGFAWLVAGILVLTAAAMIALRSPSWWWAVAVVAAVASQAVIVTSWSDAKAGTAANVALVLAAVLGFAASGPGSFVAQWDSRVGVALAAAPAPGPVVTEADLTSLPAPLAAYLRRSGVLGQPRVTSFAANVHGRIRSGPDTAWMRFTGRQVNTFGANPQRLFYLDAVRGGLPVTVFHDYHDATATMRGKVLSLLPVLDASGPVMDQGETVTVLNDMVVFAPAAVLDADVTWTRLDAYTVRGRFTNGPQTVTADLVFTADGDLATFTSPDRFRASADGTSFTRLPWDTPIDGYRTVGERRVAVSGEGRWDAPAPDGHFSYIEFHVDDIAYNPALDRDLLPQSTAAGAVGARGGATEPNTSAVDGWRVGAWLRACVVAEAIGMTAAAGAARTADSLQAHGRDPGLALAVVVGGGLVEGTALGVLQARALRTLLDRAAAWRWALVTLLVGGMGWAAASAPGVMAASGGDSRDSAAQPALLLILTGAAALGAVMGAALGAAQAAVLRSRAAKPWRWVWISALGWTAAMPVIFLGATLPSAHTPTAAVVAVGSVTGLAAGAVLGAVTGVLLPSLGGQPVVNTLLLQLLASPVHRVLGRSLLGLRVTGTVTGRRSVLPVQYAADDTGFVVLPGHHDRKRWWRNLRGGANLEMLLGGRWVAGRGRVLTPEEPGYEEAAETYRRRWPRAVLPADQPLVRLTATGAP